MHVFALSKHSFRAAIRYRNSISGEEVSMLLREGIYYGNFYCDEPGIDWKAIGFECNDETSKHWLLKTLSSLSSSEFEKFQPNV